MIDVEGIPTTAGSKIYDGRIAQRSAEVVRGAEEAGAIAVTKDATTEFAIGGPHNPGIRAGAQPVGHLALDRWILDRSSRGALLPARDRLPCRHGRGVALLARKSSFSQVSDLR